jgi:predicted extracellular nuclease
MKNYCKKSRNRRRSGLSFLILAVLVSLSVAFMGTTRKIKVMPLGDSITASFTGSASYRFWLWQDLVSAGFADKVDFVGRECGCGSQQGVCNEPQFPCSVWPCRHNGYHANTVGNILDFAGVIMASDTPDVVLIHLGTNDISSPDGGDLAYSKVQMGMLIDTIRAYNPNVTVLLCKINPPAGYRDSTMVFNNYMTQLAAEKNRVASPIVIVDQFTGYNPVFDNVDGIHPSPSGEVKLATNFFTALLPVLQKLSVVRSAIVNYGGDVRTASGEPLTLQVKAHAYPAVKDVVFITDDTVTLGVGSRVSDSLFTIALTAPTGGFHNVKAVAADYCGHTDTSASVLFGSPVNGSSLDFSIPVIQGPMETSPYENYLVKTTGVVTAITNDSSGFWLQDSLGDASDLTSDAIFIVKTGAIGMPPLNYAVSVRGIVQERVERPGSLSSTQIRCADSLVLLHDFNNGISPLPVAGVPDFDMNLIKTLYSSHEGMLVSFDNAAIAASSSGIGLAPSAMRNFGSGYYSSSGVVINEARGPKAVDYNPEALRLGNRTGSALSARVGDEVSKLKGIVDYVNGNYVIQPITDSCVVSGHVAVPASPVSVRSSGAGSFRITTLDLGGFYDTIDTWGKNDAVMTSADYSTKLVKIGKAVSQELLMPALLCLQNVENTNVMKDIAASVNALGGKYKFVTGRRYLGFSIDTPSTPSPQGLMNGFLYDSTALSLSQAFLLSGGSIDAAFGPASAFPAAEPLVGAFTAGGAVLAVVNVTFADKNSDRPYFMKDWPVYEPSKAARAAQASTVRNWINGVISGYPSVYMIVAGEFNDYQFDEPTDGADFPVSIVAGNAAKGETVFYNVTDYLSQDSRYTCIKDGRAQMTSHILVHPNLAGLAKGVDALHFNAKFEDALASNPATGIRVSTNDAVEIRF